MILKPTAYLTGTTLLVGVCLVIRAKFHNYEMDAILASLLVIPFWLIGFIYILIAYYKYKTEYKPAPFLKLTSREFWRMYWGWAAIRFGVLLIMVLVGMIYLA